MFWVWCFVTALLLLEGVLSFMRVIHFHRFFLREILTSPNQPEQEWPKVALLAPCKGLDPGLRENIRSWLALDYPDYKVFFILESEQDAAMPVIQEFKGEIMIAGKASDSGQKVHNLRHAIQQISPEINVFACVDSDCSVKPDWLRNLVSRLLRDPDDAATSYRWFTSSANFASILRAAWNSSVLSLYKENSQHNFAWGGSTAVLRETFELARVIDFWKGSISDDYSLTRAMQNSNRKVHFVPGALAFSHDSIRLMEFFRWAFRQLLITRIYYPRLWNAAFLFHCAWMFWLVTGFFFPGYFWPSFLFLQLIQSIKAELRVDCVRAVGEVSSKQRVYLWLIGPIIGLCNFVLLLSTLFTRKIVWRNVEYVLSGPQELGIRHR